ncbi:MAG: flagellar basal body protein, partial [Oscillospiraceae bacterium]
MRPTFLGFETQKRTLQVAQKNLDIAGNNISNINTVGYTRQRVDLYAM